MIPDSEVLGDTEGKSHIQKLKQFINWQGMKNDVEKYIRKCEKCQKNKMMQYHTRMPLITDTPSTEFEKYNIDIIDQFSPSSSQHRSILTEQDDLSKFLIAVPLEDQTEEQMVKAFVNHVVLTYRIPQVILSHCGSQF
jgi:ribonuclease HIII